MIRKILLQPFSLKLTTNNFLQYFILKRKNFNIEKKVTFKKVFVKFSFFLYPIFYLVEYLILFCSLVKHCRSQLYQIPLWQCWYKVRSHWCGKLCHFCCFFLCYSHCLVWIFLVFFIYSYHLLYIFSFRWDWNLAMMNSVSLLNFISYFFCFLSHRKNENESTLHIHETESWFFCSQEGTFVVWVREELFGFDTKAIRSFFLEFSITVLWKINMEIVANKIKDIDPWNIVLWKQLTANK